MENKPNINRFDINTRRNRRIENTMGGKVLHKISLVVQILLSLLFMVSGILLIIAAFNFESIPSIVEPTNQLIDDIICLGLSLLIYYFILKAKIPNFLVRIIAFLVIYTVITFFVYNFRDFSVTALQIITGLFGIITCVVLFLNVIRQIRDHAGFLRSLIWSIIYGFTGLDMLLGYQHSMDFTVIIGFYLFTFAFNIFWQSLKSLFSLSSTKKEVKRKMVTLPTVISAFLPIGFFNNLNSTVSRDDYDKNLFIDEENNKPEEDKADLTIYIHTRAGLMPGFGHVDISLDDKVYCYGNYNDSTWLLGGFVSDGVVHC